MSKLALWTCVLACGAAPLAARAQWSPQLEAAIAHDSNFSRAQRSEDQVRDTSFAARFAAGPSFPAGDDGEAWLAAEGAGVLYTSSHGASYAYLGAVAGYRRKLGLGLTAPRVVAQASYGLEDAREAVRDATRSAVSLAAAKRFDERLEATAGFAYDRRVQREDMPTVPGYSGKPFSLQGRSVFLRASWLAGGGASLLAAAALRNGDVESSTRRNPAIFAASNAIAPDPAIGADFVAYRLSGAHGRTLAAGLAYEIDRRSSLEAMLSRDDTRAGAGMDYRNVLFTVGYAYRP